MVRRVLLTSISVLFVFTAYASAQGLPSSWTVESTYANSVKGAPDKSVTWTFETSALDNGYEIHATDRAGKIRTGMAMILDWDLRMIRALAAHTIRGKQRLVERTFDPAKPAIFEDSIIPADWLNLGPEVSRSGKRSYKVRQKLSTGAIARNYTLEAGPVSLARAVEQGMIKSADAHKITGALTLYRVLMETAQGQTEVARQLLEKGSPLWLYEATPQRESRRILD